VALDCSLLAHALLPTQRTEEAVGALREINLQGHELVAAAVLFVEFPSLLRRMVARGQLDRADGEAIFDIFRRLPIRSVNTSPGNLQRAWDLSKTLGQSDTFDSMGYAIAESENAAFWTSDQRFTNAAKTKNLSHIRRFA